MHHSLPQRPSGQSAPGSAAPAPPPRSRSNLPSNLPSNPTLLQQQPQPSSQSSSSYPHHLPNLPTYPIPSTGPIYSPSGFNLASLAASNALQALSNPSPNVWAGNYPTMNPAYPGYPPQSFGVPLNSYQQTPQGYTLSTHYTSQPVPSSSTIHSKPLPSVSDHPHPTAGRPEKKAKQPKLDHQALNPTQRMRNCQLSSCHYTGLEKDVEIHEMDRHLIYPAGWKEKMERKKAKSNAGPPVPIPGTSMVLQTPEQIEAWIAERKRKWPTQARVQEKEKLHDEAVSRGELPYHSSAARGRGRGRTDRGRGNTRNHSSSSSRPYDKKPSENRSNEIRSKDRAAGLEAYEKAKREGLLDDDFDSDPLSSSSSSSSSESEDSSSEEDDSSSDEDGPPEGSSSKHPSVKGDGEEQEKAKPLCSYFNTKRGCKMGNACRFAHQVEEDSSRISNPNALRPAQQPRSTPIINPRIQPRSSTRPSLLHSLLETDIQHTISDLSQVIHFLCTNDFLRGVERHVGEREERLKSEIKTIEHGEEKVKETRMEEDTDE